MLRQLAIGLFALQCLACFESNPFLTRGAPARHHIEVSDVDFVEGQALSMLQLQLDAESYFGVDFGDRWQRTRVYWTDTHCGTEGQHGVSYRGECLSGLMFNCEDMYVALSGLDPASVCRTSLNHEFAHCLSGDLFWDFDGDHSGEIWDLVPAANARDCEE